MALYTYRHIVANERTCFWFLHRLRWPAGVRCPSCGAADAWRMHERRGIRYRCKGCRRHFSLLTGTVLEGTRLPLTKWVLAVALFKVGISARALAREVLVSRRIAWRLLWQLRRTLRTDGVLRKLRGQVEVDESYFGGRAKGKRGRGAAQKTIVLGLRTRRGRVRSLVIPTASTAAIRAVVARHVAQGSRLYTDELRSYRRARRWGFRHRQVAHRERFVRGQTHTQGIEGYWGNTKPTLVGRHRAIRPWYLQDYLAETDFKHNLDAHDEFIPLVLTRLLAPLPIQ